MANPFAGWDKTCKDVSGQILGIDTKEEDDVEGKIEDGWPMGLRVIAYLAGLLYSFYAVGLISDIFMSGIEKVTAAKKRKKDKESGRMYTAYVWNATVANLSLMALGSSAPEIMMGCFEVVLGNYLLGPLGPGVIVGSAAFNLLVISAVCINAHDEPKVTYIKETPVYLITAVFSVFAYVWLFIIIMAPWSPDVVEHWEAIVTCVLFPILLVLAYFADIGVITFGLKGAGEKKEEVGILEDATKEELAEIEQKIRNEHEVKGLKLTDEQVLGFMKAQYQTRRNKAFYAQVGLKGALKGDKKLEHEHKRYSVTGEAPPEKGVNKADGTYDDVDAEKAKHVIKIAFATENFACLESSLKGVFKLVRKGPKGKVSVKYKTREGTASIGSDFEQTEGTLTFEADEMEAKIEINIMNDNAYEEDEWFFLDLYEPTLVLELDEPNTKVEIGAIGTACMTIIDDDFPGMLRFKTETKEVEMEGEDQEINVVVERFDGSSGTIFCKYNTENMAAIAGVDYEEASGDCIMEDGAMSFNIPITIKASARKQKKSFNVNLIDIDCLGTQAAKDKVGFDPKTDGGEESCICNVQIVHKNSEGQDNLLSMMQGKLSGARIAHEAYAQQFKDALFKVLDDEEEEGEDGEEAVEKVPTAMDYAFHIAGLPWKLLFAIVPPTDYCGGYLTFFFALAFIGLVTIVVGDLANLLGCSLAIPAEITAITFVALGTSLPDTFASKTAAEIDPYADNSIGNVTGSNSVNVFLGCGLAWSIGAIHWYFLKFDEPATVMAQVYKNPDWKPRDDSVHDAWLVSFAGMEDVVKDNVLKALGCEKDKACKADSHPFMVPSGSLWFNLLVFSINALLAILLLYIRRVKFGGELGGPKGGFLGQHMSGAILVCQWFSYIILSSLMCLWNLGAFD
jgi:solute carrier family 8 (sodium/calcium exchanger)